VSHKLCLKIGRVTMYVIKTIFLIYKIVVYDGWRVVLECVCKTYRFDCLWLRIECVRGLRCYVTTVIMLQIKFKKVKLIYI